LHLQTLALIIMWILFLLTVALIVMLWKRSKLAAFLIILYPLWIVVASYFAYQILVLN
jgi:tryptophan-rich sensory protein